MRAGIRGERDAAYEIEFHLGKNPNRMTIHDLRLEVDGRVAQIDHLIIDRLLAIWVCESKHFAEGVAINDHGEWTAFYGRPATASPHPSSRTASTSRSSIDVFAKGVTELPGGSGVTIKPQLRSLVLVSNSARITRPKSAAARARIAGLESVIKVDQLMKALNAELDACSLHQLARAVGAETIERIGRNLVALHRPPTFDWSGRYGVSPSIEIPAAPEPARTPAREATAARCDVCGRSVSPAVVAYCGEHRDRFGGRLLCFDCQRAGAGSAARGT